MFLQLKRRFLLFVGQNLELFLLVSEKFHGLESAKAEGELNQILVKHRNRVLQLDRVSVNDESD